MKLAMLVTMFGVVASMGDAASPAAYFRSLEAPPEAMFMGASLLSLAALIRAARPAKKNK